MRSTEYATFSDKQAGHVNVLENTLSRQTRRNQARNLARAHKKEARKNWFKKTV